MLYFIALNRVCMFWKRECVCVYNNALNIKRVLIFYAYVFSNKNQRQILLTKIHSDRILDI